MQVLAKKIFPLEPVSIPMATCVQDRLSISLYTTLHCGPMTKTKKCEPKCRLEAIFVLIVHQMTVWVK